MKSLKRFLLSYHAIRILGLLILSASVLLSYHNETKLSFNDIPHNQHISPPTHEPNLLIIRSLDIQLPVAESVIKFGIWEVNPEGASHLASSSNPGDPGNIIIYAHDTNNRFGFLPDIKPNGIIELRSRNNTWHSYKVASTQIVDPSDVNVLKPNHPQELTLYTCYGFADLKRFVVKAVPI